MWQAGSDSGLFETKATTSKAGEILIKPPCYNSCPRKPPRVLTGAASCLPGNNARAHELCPESHRRTGSEHGRRLGPAGTTRQSGRGISECSKMGNVRCTSAIGQLYELGRGCLWIASGRFGILSAGRTGKSWRPDELLFPGDVIYVDTELYLSRGKDDFCGGLAEVIEFRKDINAVKPTPCVVIASKRQSQYNWRPLTARQKQLRSVFGKT